ncbi:MAG: 5-methylcytosine-specific restriction endonuclease system specificity protein McrC [Gracilibacteraceae bacterium]|nr:5-methylcytosine-specific restriction endonuclease system specificity protein McrC [Gracilibacteraceae bacterium]
MVKVGNIYIMLAYAFRSLNAGGISYAGNEDFDNLHELFAEIIIGGMRKQLKRGLPRQYSSQREELSNLRGKIDLQTSIRQQTMVRHRLVCEFDEFTEDTPGNRLIKCAITHLLKQSDVSYERKHFLKFLRASLDNVADVQSVKVPQQRTGGAEYAMLVNVCGFLLDGLLMNTGGGYRMREWLTDDALSSLYERFLLAYFKRHYAFKAKKAQIDWDMPEVPAQMPKMESDVYLTHNGRTLIIDAKCYSRTMSKHFGKKTYHSHNLYQIYTYVKNADKAKDGSVSGMLLYAKTDEDITPDNDSIIGGNGISVKTLDLTQDFSGIRSQLAKVAAVLQ